MKPMHVARAVKGVTQIHIKRITLIHTVCVEPDVYSKHTHAHAHVAINKQSNKQEVVAVQLCTRSRINAGPHDTSTLIREVVVQRSS